MIKGFGCASMQQSDIVVYLLHVIHCRVGH
jgi:hypothetical protein